MLKKNITIVLVVLTLFMLCGCGKREEFTIIGETSQGTSIVEYDENTIEWEATPDSDCFSEVAYKAATKTLFVRFRDSGLAYGYLEFPAAEWKTFRQQDSLGAWYNLHVKGEYKCVRLNK